MIWQSLNIQGKTNAGFQVGGFAANTTQILLPYAATYILTLTASAGGISPGDLFQIVDVTNGFPGTIVAIFPPFTPLFASQSVVIKVTRPSTIIAIQDATTPATVKTYSLSIAADVSF